MKQKSLRFWITTGIVSLFAIIVIFDSFYTVKSTERGVLSTFGKIHDNVVEDGLHVKAPFIQSVK